MTRVVAPGRHCHCTGCHLRVLKAVALDGEVIRKIEALRRRLGAVRREGEADEGAEDARRDGDDHEEGEE